MPLDNETPEIRNNPKPMEASDDSKDPSTKKETVIAAHNQAEEDMEKDPDLNSDPKPEDDLDEGELARLGDDDETEK